MAFSLFKKGSKKEPATPPKEERASSLVPIGESEGAQEKNAGTARPVRQRTWRNFPLGSDAILNQPILTEKAMKLSTVGKYVFNVSTTAGKLAIKKAFFNAYGVMPSKVAVIRQEGKVVRYGRYSGRRRNVKKAIITVPKGKSIDLGI